MQQKNLQKLIRQARKMQKKLEADVEGLQVKTSSGGGMVNVTMNANKCLLSLTINAEAVDPNDVEMLQDLILAAVNEANRQIDETVKKRLGGLGEGLLSAD